jgi:hypothetical protein
MLVRKVHQAAVTLHGRGHPRVTLFRVTTLRLLASACALTWILLPVVPIAGEPQATTSARTWIGQEQRIEDHLRTAEVTTVEDIGIGVTRPRRAGLSPTEPVASLAWKVLPPGRRGGYFESYKSEIAAYELDKLLGLRMVPPAVERRINGEIGAAIMWLQGLRSVKELGGKVPSGPAWAPAIRKMVMFDNLVANADRNAGNILIGQPGELILIDHSRAFITDTDVKTFERVDAALWDRMRALTRDDLSRVLDPWIDSAAIDGIIARRNRMAGMVDRLVAKKGRALVIIPE